MQIKDSKKFKEAYDELNSEYLIYKQAARRDSITPFPSTLLLCNLDSTISNIYSDDEQADLYGESDGDDSSTGSNGYAVINAMKASYRKPGNDQGAGYRRQYNNRASNSYRSTNRSRINTFCKCCGSFGHDVFTNGCDFVAMFIKTDEFLTKNPNMVPKIVADYHKHQQARKYNTPQKANMSQRFQNTAGKRNVKVTGAVKTLFDIVGDTLENGGIELFDDEAQVDPTVRVLDRVEDLQLQSASLEEEEFFHDTTTQQE